MKILLPFDGSPVALEAVKFVIRMADDGLDTSVVLANVQEPASLYELMVAHDPQVIEQVSAADCKQRVHSSMLQAWLTKWRWALATPHTRWWTSWKTMAVIWLSWAPVAPVPCAARCWVRCPMKCCTQPVYR
ncbi:MAG: hypothetical protein RLZZ371_1072 [Pseudomonadota bacterium]